MQFFKFLIVIVVIVFQIPNRLNGQGDYIPPVLSDSDSWTMILLPDPQSYVKFGRNQGIFEIMTGWIEENIDPLNIEMV